MIGEFELIDLITAELGDQTRGTWVGLGPGDDAALLMVPVGEQLAVSVDTLIPDVHFPARAHPELIGYRSLAISASDLAAMGANPLGALVALVLPRDGSVDWVRGLARGLARACADFELPIVGGNLARGSHSISVTVHGSVAAEAALCRTGAAVGDRVWVSGQLGGAAYALEGYIPHTAAKTAKHALERATPDSLDGSLAPYFCPKPRLQLGRYLRGRASAAIDISDGLVADLGHLCRASQVAVELHAVALPNAPKASLEQVLFGGDDYELCFCAPLGAISDEMAARWQLSEIGQIVASHGDGDRVSLDGVTLNARGFDHFAN